MIKLDSHHQCSVVMHHCTVRLKLWTQIPALTLTNYAQPTLGGQYLIQKMKGQDG